MLNALFLKIKRGETPFFRAVRNFAIGVRSSTLPLPGFARPLLGAVFRTHTAIAQTFRWSISYFYYEPLFRGRCASVGKRIRIWRLPFVIGHAKIYLGDDVNFFGQVDIFSGAILDEL